ncbi:EAL domain-containing protein [Azospirillum doebereinerae]|uniref:EAL domain-containing protein n=1 Tax=Azospirillum doebereinerae TaxID=92933 RepID=A0A3S0XPA1_9PROT|nr:EAL domain-containing protein [Azospirillum doebereinerae]MCG5242561.1 EAL domain-containing protein [Azospirillum doebereinerae]RUQ74058.1 EAL domain-containing protein [Azospirillum doebereinerae]
MTVLTHIVYALAYIVAGLSIGVTLPIVLPASDPLLGWLAGVVTILGGALIHDVVTRLERERLASRRIHRLHATVEALAEELARHRATVAEEGERHGAAMGYDAVMQEVKLLQSLVTRLTERRAPRPPAGLAAGDRRAPASGEALAPAPPPVQAAGPMNDSSVLEAVRDALGADRIDIYLQPIVSLPQRKHRFYEVFSRVRSADGQLIMPDRYLDIAEREGLIATIDNLLLVRCIQLIRETERRQHSIVFFSNISAATLSDGDFMRPFLELMTRNQALVPKLVFELSQEDLRTGGAVTLGILSQLSRLGFHFSMDQVTSLDIDVEMLLRHQFRYVKLDRALVLDPDQTARVKDLRRRFAAEGIDLIVEKIETENQLIEVLDTGFDFGQGYLFGEPRLSRKPG